MKITISKSQWEEIGSKAGWSKTAQGRMDRNEEEMYPTTGKNTIEVPPNLVSSQLSDIISRLNKMQSDFRHVSTNFPRDKWVLIEKDCDAVLKYLDNAAGRISTISHRLRK